MKRKKKAARRSLGETVALIKAPVYRPVSQTVFASAVLKGTGSIKSSVFYIKIADLKFYGLLKKDKGDLVLTDIAKNICSASNADTERQAKIKALLYPEDFRIIYSRLPKETPFPVTKYIINDLMDNLKEDEPTTRALLDSFFPSGEYAGVVTKEDGGIAIQDVGELAPPAAAEQAMPEAALEARAEVEKPVKPVKERPIVKPQESPQPLPSLTVNLNVNIPAESGSVAEAGFDFLRQLLYGERPLKPKSYVVTTEPPEGRELLATVTELIDQTQRELVVVSPYIDHELLPKVLEKAEVGVAVTVVTRKRDQIKGGEPKKTFDTLQKTEGINHFTNETLHCRMVMGDEYKAIVTSADLTHDSLVGQFNAGVVTTELDIIKKCKTLVSKLTRATG